MLNSSVQAASTAASTTGRYSGWQPGHHRVDRDLLDRARRRGRAARSRRPRRARASCPRACAAPAPASAARPAGRRSSRARTAPRLVLERRRARRAARAACPPPKRTAARRRLRVDRASSRSPAAARAARRRDRATPVSASQSPRCQPTVRSASPPSSTRSSVGTVSMSRRVGDVERRVVDRAPTARRERRVVLREDGERHAAGELARAPARPARRSGSRASRRR